MARVSFVIKIHQRDFSSATTVLNYLMHRVCWLNKHNFISSTKTVRELEQPSMTEKVLRDGKQRLKERKE